MLLASMSAHAENWAGQDDWTVEDTAFEAYYGVTVLADLATSLDIKNHGNLIESNHALGQHPTDYELERYMTEMFVTHALIANLLPEHMRGVWQGFGIAYEANAVQSNLKLGLLLKF